MQERLLELRRFAPGFLAVAVVIFAAASGQGLLVLIGALFVAAALGVRQLGGSLPLALGVFYVLAVSGVVGFGVTAVNAAETLSSSNPRVEYQGKLTARDFYPRTTDVDTGKVEDQLADARRSSGAIVEQAEARVSVGDASTWEIALWLLQELGPWLLGGAVMWLLYPVLLATRRGEPFEARHAGRIAAIGRLLLIWLPGLELFRALLAVSLTNEIGTIGGFLPDAEWRISLLPFLPGIFVLVLASVFRRGAELQQFEQETV